MTFFVQRAKSIDNAATRHCLLSVTVILVLRATQLGRYVVLRIVGTMTLTLCHQASSPLPHPVLEFHVACR